MRLLPLLLAVVLIGTIGCNKNAASSAPPATQSQALVEGAVAGSKGVAPRIGYTAPDFYLMDIHDKAHRLSSYRGRVVLLNFWATWCGPCRIEMPAIQALSEQYSTQQLQVLSVAGDVDGKNQVAPFMERLRLTFPGLLDSDARIQDMYRVNALPMTYVIDPNGVVAYKFVGFFDWNAPKYRKLLNKLMVDA